jgi:hypothetical protein
MMQKSPEIIETATENLDLERMVSNQSNSLEKTIDSHQHHKQDCKKE